MRSMIYLPMLNKSMYSYGKSPSRKMRGRGIGGVLLDGGMGGQSSYSSLDDYSRTTGNQIVGSGSRSYKKDLSRIQNKIENLMVKPPKQKLRNINFSL